MQAVKVRSNNRQGIFIVLVLIILVVFAIMGVVIYSTGSTEYNHTMLVAYKIKADNLAQAVVEESLCVLYDKVSRPVDINIDDDETGGRTPPPWKALLFEKVLEVAGDSDAATDIGVILSFDLLSLGMIPESVALLASQDCIVEECVIDFEGFRKIWSYPNGLFVKNRGLVYYKDPKNILDEEDYEYPYPNDFQGYAVIKVKVRYGSGRISMSRHLSSIHDIKLVNQTPMARKFALFQWYPNPDETSQQQDLNNGGGLKIFPNNKARMFVRGPYVTDTYGEEQGIGGDSAPSGSINYWGGDWHGWSNIPSSRAGIMSARLWSQQSPMRPDRTSKTGLDLGFGGFTVSSDPGFTLGADQMWICASEPNTPENNFNSFSLMGDPASPEAADHYQTFEGLLVKAADDGGETNHTLAPAGEWPPNPTNELEDLWLKRIEGGGLYQRSHQAKFDQRKFSIGLFGASIDYVSYSVDIVNNNVTMPYGCYFMPNIEPEALGAWLSLACSAVLGFVGLGGGTFAGILDATAMEFFKVTMMQNAVDAMVGGFGESSTGTVPYNGDTDPNTVVGFYPSQFRDIPRLASRSYYSLDDIESYVMDDPDNFPIMLDGTIIVHTLNDQRWFKYIGKGSLVSNNGGGDDARRNPVMEAPIMAYAGPMVDHLNIVYSGKQADGHVGDDMLIVKASPDNPDTFIDGSVFSVQGVRPEDGTGSVTIGGNYLCGYFNKAMTPPDTEVLVRYNVDYKPKEDGSEEDKILAFEDGRWHSASISFRSAGWYEQRRE